ncbi:NifU family protein [Oceaniglobus indicus]|uniref:NifU family protein n=1 Tax=Oceaniglobus indicus TaxID=2047749 RepID=UPI000C1A18B3|nr:NifU family protein [Oceaniglobus indicus]
MSETRSRRRIRAQASPRDPATMRFILDEPVQNGRAASFDSPADAAPLARALFAVDGVNRIQVSGETILVTRHASHDWDTLKPAIAAAIRHVLDSTDSPLGPDAPPSPELDVDETLLAAVTKILDTRANPAIASHGGHISAERVDNGNVYLRMSGGCQGCAASAITLRRGVETTLRAALPMIRDIIDVTDHASGDKPFYQDEAGQSPAFARPLPPGSVGWEDEQLVIDPDYLAPRMGLTPEVLQAGLAGGDITIESEPNAAIGGMRVIVRSPQRAWAADVGPDGSAYEIPPPRSARTNNYAPSLAAKIRVYLEKLPAGDLPVTYGRLARGLRMFAPGSIRRVTEALETTMRQDADAGRPFIAARVVGRGSGKLPGNGFFELAEKLGQSPQAGETRQAFHQRLLRESIKAR